MAALCSTQLLAARPARAAARRSVQARASAEKPVAVPAAFRNAKLSAGVAAAASFIMASPAFALVDDRLNGDGAGIALGVSDPILGAHLAGVFTTIWALYYLANKSDSKIKAGGQNDDSGLSL